jgi:hypothetical protein
MFFKNLLSFVGVAVLAAVFTFTFLSITTASFSPFSPASQKVLGARNEADAGDQPPGKHPEIAQKPAQPGNPLEDKPALTPQAQAPSSGPSAYGLEEEVRLNLEAEIVPDKDTPKTDCRQLQQKLASRQAAYQDVLERTAERFEAIASSLEKASAKLSHSGYDNQEIEAKIEQLWLKIRSLNNLRSALQTDLTQAGQAACQATPQAYGQKISSAQQNLNQIRQEISNIIDFIRQNLLPELQEIATEEESTI